MNVIIAGAGEVGGHAAEVLSERGNKITVIDLDDDRLRRLGERVDLRTLKGHCAHFDVLREAGAQHGDLMIAATHIDEVNMLAASMAKAAGVKKTIVRVHHTANFSLRGTPYANQLGIDELICPEYLTSLAIARSVRNPGSIAIEEFARGKLLMQRIPVTKGAPAVGKTLLDITMPPRTRVATVERNGVATIANAAATIGEGDLVTLIGETSQFEATRRLFNKGKQKRIHLAVMGESSTAVWLCRAFDSRMFSVRLFVEDHKRAEALADKLSHVTVLEADPTDATTSLDEHMERVDVFIAVTDDDERNILSCAHAKRLGVATTVVIMQRSKYLQLLPHVGIDHAFSPRSDAVKAIMHRIDRGPIHSLATFADGIAEVYEVRPSRKAKIIGHELRNITMSEPSMIAAIHRGDNVYVPGADDQVLAGDTILVIGRQGIGDELAKLCVKK